MKPKFKSLLALLLILCIMLSVSAYGAGSSMMILPDNSPRENNTDNADDKNNENQQANDHGWMAFDCYCQLSKFRETISALSGDEFDALLAKENIPFDIAQRYVETTKDLKVPAILGTNQRMAFAWDKKKSEFYISNHVFTDKIDYDFYVYKKNESIMTKANEFITEIENINDSSKTPTLDFCGYAVTFKITVDAANYYDKATTMEGYLILEDYVINIFSDFTVRRSSPDSAPSAESFLAELDFDMLDFYTSDEMIEIRFTGEPGSFFEHDWHEDTPLNTSSNEKTPAWKMPVIIGACAVVVAVAAPGTVVVVKKKKSK